MVHNFLTLLLGILFQLIVFILVLGRGVSCWGSFRSITGAGGIGADGADRGGGTGGGGGPHGGGGGSIGAGGGGIPKNNIFQLKLYSKFFILLTPPENRDLTSKDLLTARLSQSFYGP